MTGDANEAMGPVSAAPAGPITGGDAGDIASLHAQVTDLRSLVEALVNRPEGPPTSSTVDATRIITVASETADRAVDAANQEAASILSEAKEQAAAVISAAHEAARNEHAAERDRVAAARDQWESTRQQVTAHLAATSSALRQYHTMMGTTVTVLDEAIAAFDTGQDGTDGLQDHEAAGEIGVPAPNSAEIPPGDGQGLSGSAHVGPTDGSNAQLQTGDRLSRTSLFGGSSKSVGEVEDAESPGLATAPARTGLFGR